MSNNWWANKLGGQPSNTFQTPPPAPRPVQQPTPPVENIRVSERCPGCGSQNYGGATPESRKRCYDCGYPIVQSGTGMRGVNTGQSAAGPAQPAKQVSTGGYNPTTIIGKI